MKDDNEEDKGSASSSPIPVSTWPDNHKHSFSSVPSLTPPFSPLGSSNSSAENLSLLRDSNFTEPKKDSASLSFSLYQTQSAQDSSPRCLSCFMKLLEWFAVRCSSCCAWNLNKGTPSKLHHD